MVTLNITFSVVFSILKLGCMYRLLHKHGIYMAAYIRKLIWGGGGDSWYSCILISGSSFIFTDEMNHFRYYLTSSAPCLKGFPNTKL